MLQVTIDLRRLRGRLAEEKVPYKQFATSCGLSTSYVRKLLNEERELTTGSKAYHAFIRYAQAHRWGDVVAVGV